MNLSSKFLLFVALVLSFVHVSSEALQLQGLYTSACRRQIGVVVDISEGKVSLLRIDGKLVKIPRYEVIFLVSYPIDRFPYSGESDLKNVDFYRIKSEIKGELKPFIQGWPVGFTEDKVSFMNQRGNEVIVDRENIWEIEKVRSGRKQLSGISRRGKSLRFGHPYNFRNCPIAGNPKNKITYPQDVISNPITIKTVFDQLEAGHDKMDRYNKEQSFYPVPLVFENRTSLGIWQDVGGRHGASNNRSSHLTPMLEDNYASDIFDYQHQFLSGSAPNLNGSHEEVQTQASYRMKASYFHFSAMLDPNLILVGQNYAWTKNDLEDLDDRVNDVSIIEMGLDFGYWSIRLIPGHVMSAGIQFDDFFFEDQAVSTSGFGLKYQRKDWSLDFQATTGAHELDDEAELKMSVVRANLHLNLSKKFEADLSAIARRLNYSSTTSEYNSASNTGAAYIYYNWNYRWRLGGYAAIESNSNDYENASGDDSQSRIFPKAGAMTSLSF